MTHAFHAVLTAAFPNAPWLRKQELAVDVIDALSMALGSEWDVHREIDYAGEVSIIALPADDIETIPALILYEAAGLAHIGTVRGVEWESDHAFSSFRQAVAAMIATADAIVIDHQAAGSNDRVRRKTAQCGAGKC